MTSHTVQIPNRASCQQEFKDKDRAPDHSMLPKPKDREKATESKS